MAAGGALNKAACRRSFSPKPIGIGNQEIKSTSERKSIDAEFLYLTHRYLVVSKRATIEFKSLVIKSF
jgi:hypothetical protein